MSDFEKFLATLSDEDAAKVRFEIKRAYNKGYFAGCRDTEEEYKEYYE